MQQNNDDILASLSDAELAILQATKSSANAQTAEALAVNAEATIETASQALASLVGKGILQAHEEFNGTTYSYPDNDYAQAIYDALYGPLEEGDGHAAE